MPVVNGAALVVNDPVLQSRLDAQLDYVSDATGFKYEYFKKIIKTIVPNRNYNLIVKLIKIKQALRNLLKGSPVTVSSSESEYTFPVKRGPHVDLKKYMVTMDEKSEVERRRLLYQYLVDYLGGDVELIRELDNNVVPYVFPFRCNDIGKIKVKLKKISLDCYQWPELPEKIQLSCPDHYKNVWMVPFLW